MNGTAMISTPAPANTPVAPAGSWRLWHLFALTAFAAVEFALARTVPLLFVLLAGLAAGVAVYRLLRNPETPRSEREGIVFATFVGLATMFLAGVLFEPFFPASHPAIEFRRASERSRMKEIVFGLHAHRTVKQSLPSPTSLGAGSSRRSWRVDLLPFLEFGSVAASYDATLTWDAPSNRRLWRAFSTQGGPPYLTDETGRTAIVAIVDENGDWPADVRAFFGLASATAPNQAIAPPTFVQLPKPGPIWTEPRDLGPGSLSGDALTVDGRVVDEVLVGFADGSAEFLTIAELKELAPRLFLSPKP